MVTFTIPTTGRQGYQGFNTRTTGAVVYQNNVTTSGFGTHTSSTSFPWIVWLVFTLENIPKGANVDGLTLDFALNNTITANTASHCYITVENNLDPLGTGLITSGNLGSDPWNRLYNKSQTYSPARRGPTHSGNNATTNVSIVDPTAHVYKPLVAAGGQGSSSGTGFTIPATSTVTTSDFGPALQPLVDDPGWNPVSQDVMVCLTFAGPAVNSNATWPIDFGGNNLVWNNGVVASKNTYELNTGQFRFFYSPSANAAKLNLAFSATSLEFTGTSLSSGNVSTARNECVGRWYGEDAVISPPIYGGLLPYVTAGRHDLSPTYSEGGNVLNAGWVASEGNPTNARCKIRASGRGVYNQRKYLYTEDHALGSNNPFFGWNLDKWADKFTGKDLSTYSARFYSRQTYATVGTNGHLISGYRDGTLKWVVEIAGNADAFGDGRIRLTGHTGWSTARLTQNSWNRIELQVSKDASPNFQLRGFRNVSSQNDVSEVADILLSANLTEDQLTIDRLHFGGKRSSGIATLLFTSIADLEIWSGYDLGGEFAADIIDPMKGYPFKEPTWDWFEFDGEKVVALEDTGVVRTVDSDGTNTKLTTDFTDNSDLTFAANLTGADGTVAVGNSNFTGFITTSDSDLTIDTDLVPAGVSKGLICSSNNSDTAAYTSLTTDKLYTRFYFRAPSFPGGGTLTALQRVEDNANAPIYGIRLTPADAGQGSLSLISGQNSSVATLATIQINTWYMIETHYSKNAGRVAVRVQRADGNPDPLVAYGDYAVPQNVATVNRVLWGSYRGRSTDGTPQPGPTSYVCHIAAHAADTTDWIQGVSGGVLPPFEPRTSFGGSGLKVLYRGPDYVGPSGMVQNLDLDYGIDVQTPYRRLNIYRPVGDPPPDGWKTVVWMHGGSWQGGSRTEFPDSFRDQCIARNYAFVSVGYQLAPGYDALGGGFTYPSYARNTVSGRWPTFVCDYKEAVAWLKINAATYNINPDRLCASGYSAGSFNVLAALTTTNLSGSDGSDFNVTLAGNSGEPYRYANIPDPTMRCGYVWAPPVSLGGLLGWNEGQAWYPMVDTSHGPAYYAGKAMMANYTGWEDQLEFLSVTNWVNLNKSNMIPIGAEFGESDYFVLADPYHRFPEFSGHKELEDALSMSGLPDGVDASWLGINDQSHDWAMHEFDADRFFRFLRKHL